MSGKKVAWEDNEELTELEEELLERLKSVSTQFDFIYGVMCLCQGDKASKAMLGYLDKNPNAEYSDILYESMIIADIFNPQLSLNE